MRSEVDGHACIAKACSDSMCSLKDRNDGYWTEKCRLVELRKTRPTGYTALIRHRVPDIMLPYAGQAEVAPLLVPLLFS